MEEYKTDVEGKRILLAKCRAELGNSHEETLEAIDDLAEDCEYDCLFDEAIALRTEAWQTRCEVLGKHHPKTFRSRTYLAEVMFNSGLREEGLAMLEESVAEQRKVLGDRDPTTICSLRLLADHFMMLDRYEDHIAVRRELHEYYEERYGANHEKSIRSLIRLASANDIAEKNEEAIKICMDVLELCAANLPPGHTCVFQCLSRLAFCSLKSGFYQEAVRYYEEALIRYPDAEDPDDCDVGYCHAMIADIYEHLNRLDKTIEHAIKARDWNIANSGSASFDTKLARSRLGGYYLKNNQFAEALETLEEVCAYVPEPEDARTKPKLLQRTFYDFTNLAACYEHFGRIDEAITAQSEAIKLMIEYQGVEWKRTVEAVEKLDSLKAAQAQKQLGE